MAHRIIKSFILGISFCLGLMTTSIVAVTINSTFSSGAPLTAAAMNEIKNALVALPNWIKGTNPADAVYNDGNVGIGIDPTVKLEVNGAVKATSFIGDGSGLTGVSPFSQHYTTGDMNFTLGALQQYAHNLGGAPTLVTFEFVCTVANNGYAVGDRVPFSSFFAANSGNRSAGYNATYVFYAIDTVSYLSSQKTAGGTFFTPSPANWKVNVHAWR